MEATAFFEKKISLNAKDLNKVGRTAKMDDLIMEKLRELVEDKCSEHGFVLPGTLALVSRSMGYFEPGRFTGDAVYYVKASGQVLYPADGVRIVDHHDLHAGETALRFGSGICHACPLCIRPGSALARANRARPVAVRGPCEY